MKFFELYRKTKKKDEPINRYFNRFFSSIIIKFIYKTNLKPNHFTLLSFAFGMSSCLFFVSGTKINFIIGGFILELASILDCVDGDLARLKKLVSEKGKFYDLISDRIVDSFVFLSIGIGIFKQNQNLLELIVILSGLIGLTTMRYMTSVFKELNKNNTTIQKRYLSKIHQLYRRFGSFLKSIYLGRGLFIFLIFLFSILEQLNIGIILISIYFWINFIIMLFIFLKSM